MDPLPPSDRNQPLEDPLLEDALPLNQNIVQPGDPQFLSDSDALPTGNAPSNEEIRGEGIDAPNNTQLALNTDLPFKEIIEGLAANYRTRKEFADSLNLTNYKLDKLRKRHELKFPWSKSKKSKHSTPSTSSSSASSASTARGPSLAAAASSMAATLSSLQPLLATSLKDLPSSSSSDRVHKYKSLGIYDKPDIKAREIQYLNEFSIMVRVNFQAPDGSWNLLRFKIVKSTKYEELIRTLNRKLRHVRHVPQPQNMEIYYEDTSGKFCVLEDEEDMIMCLEFCHPQKFVNLVIDH